MYNGWVYMQGFFKLNFNIYYEPNKKLTYTPCYVLVKNKINDYETYQKI